ncbi:MAG: Protein-tyrosine-phosphatase [Conexibacter sp.]|jgi:protein-tyrosine phosphatase|nr:Protein-tyrosine-phosphatase [Conexibacter sp.]
MIDLHCHLLPGIDDGPSGEETAVEMARLHLAAGVHTVAATPHVSPSMPNDAAGIAAATNRMRAALQEHDVPLAIVAGAEVDLRRAGELDDAELQALTLGDGPWLLLEAPLQAVGPLEAVVGDLVGRGHRILLAHPERSPMVQRDPHLLVRLAHAGVLTQVTASSLAGAFGRPVQRFAQRMMAEDLVQVVASDAHDPRRRPPGLSEPLIRAGHASRVAWLTDEVPVALLAGDRIPPPPARRPARRRGLRGILRDR